MSMTEHVPVTLMSGGTGHIPVELRFPWGTGDEFDWVQRPAALEAHHLVFKGRPKKRGKEKSVLVLDAYGCVILRRSLVDKILAGIPGSTLDLVPVRLLEDQQPLDDDFALLDPRLTFPMDRDASEATWEVPANPHGSFCVAATRLAWREGCAPQVTAFRLAEHPRVVMLRRDVAEALATATKHLLALVEPPYPAPKQPFGIDVKPVPLRQHPPWGVPSGAAPWQDAEGGARSAAAFWDLLSGRGDAQARAQVCQSPHYALWLAQLVDHGPAPDTRQAALRHPFCAYQYAVLVDRRPGDDSRAAASAVPWGATDYACFVDHGPHGVTRQGVAGTDFAASYDKSVQQAQHAWALLHGASLPAPPPATQPAAPPVPSREWPAHRRPRYAEPAPEPGALPTHDAVDAAVRSDIDAFTGQGLEAINLDANARPEDVVNALHAFIGEVQAKTRKLGHKKKATTMALGCALGEQLHRALGWQWASVRTAEGGGIALVSPDRAVALYPLFLVERLLDAKARSNTLALTFNMVADGQSPPGSKPGAYTALT